LADGGSAIDEREIQEDMYLRRSDLPLTLRTTARTPPSLLLLLMSTFTKAVRESRMPNRPRNGVGVACLFAIVKVSSTF
jgi:hypothetical protein